MGFEKLFGVYDHLPGGMISLIEYLFKNEISFSDPFKHDGVIGDWEIRLKPNLGICYHTNHDEYCLYQIDHNDVYTPVKSSKSFEEVMKVYERL